MDIDLVRVSIELTRHEIHEHLSRKSRICWCFTSRGRRLWVWMRGILYSSPMHSVTEIQNSHTHTQTQIQTHREMRFTNCLPNDLCTIGIKRASPVEPRLMLVNRISKWYFMRMSWHDTCALLCSVCKRKTQQASLIFRIEWELIILRAFWQAGWIVYTSAKNNLLNCSFQSKPSCSCFNY